MIRLYAFALLLLAVQIGCGGQAPAQEPDLSGCPDGMFRSELGECMKRLRPPPIEPALTPQGRQRQSCVSACAAKVDHCVANCGADLQCNIHCSDDRHFRCLQRCDAPLKSNAE